MKSEEETDYLYYYRQAKKQGWKPDIYSIKIEFNPSIRLNFNNLDYCKAVNTLKKYLNYNLTFKAHIFKNGKEVNTNEFFELVEVANKQKYIFNLDEE